jgi:hypothetical protein
MLGGARLLSAVEDHDGGHQLVRVRIWPVFAWTALVGVAALAGLSVWSGLEGSLAVSAMLGLGSLSVGVRTLYESGTAVSACLCAVHQRVTGAIG